MINLKLFPYYNRHIEFKLISGETNSGIILDTLDDSEKMVKTWHSFIPSAHVTKWKHAMRMKDERAMKQYERIIDIQRIVGATPINLSTVEPNQRVA